MWIGNFSRGSRSGKTKEKLRETLILTGDDALSVCSLRALQRVEEVREAANGNGTEARMEVRFACEPNRSDCCCRENLLHALLHFACCGKS